jgi:hypothetical protein
MHAVAIRLHDKGFGDHAIAVALEIDDDQVLGVLSIAEAKVANLLASEGLGPASRAITQQKTQPTEERL